jgi:uncharacterized protein YbjT (DUF2867 family)
MKIRAIITGSTGMVGEGVLHECLNSADVEAVLVINRRPCGIIYEKLQEIILKDFNDIASISQSLTGYNAFYFCSGVTSLGKNESDYTRLTYDLTLTVAKTASQINNDMTFCYVSGAGTDSSEKGRSMWARVKGKTENDLLKLPFKAAYMFRPGFMNPTKGLKNAYSLLKYVAPFYPIFDKLFTKYVTTLAEVGLAMINVTTKGYDKKIIECTDIRKLAKQ